MRFLFRADASISIGTGHIVRCATLAAYLARAGHEVLFLCRGDTGNLNSWLGERELPIASLDPAKEGEEGDARQCLEVLRGRRFDWLVVDHYGLDETWERVMAGTANAILAIDDLGRPHACNLMLDQNYRLGRPMNAGGHELLSGPQFALVAPEFARHRPASLARKRDRLDRLLVFMGGSDPGNETAKALLGVGLANFSDIGVDVVIGAGNPHRQKIEVICAGMKNAILHVQTSRMAQLMASADCTIAAGGSSTWERCTLGLPALVSVLSADQAPIAADLAAMDVHISLGWHDKLAPDDIGRALNALNGTELARMSRAAAAICDGHGAARVAARLLGG